MKIENLNVGIHNKFRRTDYFYDTISNLTSEIYVEISLEQLLDSTLTMGSAEDDLSIALTEIREKVMGDLRRNYMQNKDFIIILTDYIIELKVIKTEYYSGGKLNREAKLFVTNIKRR